MERFNEWENVKDRGRDRDFGWEGWKFEHLGSSRSVVSFSLLVLVDVRSLGSLFRTLAIDGSGSHRGTEVTVIISQTMNPIGG